MTSDTPGATTSANVDSYVPVDSFSTQPPASGSFISQGLVSSDDAHAHAVRQSQTCPIHDAAGPTHLFNSAQINNSARGLVRSTSAGSCGRSSHLHTPRNLPRRKLARWNSLDACLAEELDRMPGKVLATAPPCARPMAALQEEGNVSDTSDSTLTLGTVKKGQIYPRGLERIALSTGAKSPAGASNTPPSTALKAVDVSQGTKTRISDATGSSKEDAGALEAASGSPHASSDVTEVVSTAFKLGDSTDTGAQTVSDGLAPPHNQGTPHAAASDERSEVDPSRDHLAP